MDIVKSIEQSMIRTDLPDLKIGDFLKVNIKVKEGTRERIQSYEGTLIARQGKGLTETINVRRISYGIGVERIIPLNSQKIASIEIIRRGQVRRAKLFYLRDRVGKSAKIKEKLTSK